MSFSIADSINGRKIRLVYGVKSSPVSSDLSFIAKSKSFDAFVRRHECTHSCFVTKSGFTTIYTAETGGVSFLPILEDWIELLVEEKKMDAFSLEAGVIFPLDSRLYLAVISGGMISEEFVLLPEKADDKINEWKAENRSIFCFEGGEQTPRASNFATPEKLANNIAHYNLTLNIVAFTKNRFLHRQHLVVVVSLFVLSLVASIFYSGKESEVVQLVPRPVVLAPQSEHAAATQLGHLATAMHLNKSLFSSGVQTLVYSFSDNQIAYIGTLGVEEYPEKVQRFAEIHGLEYKHTKTGWSLLSDVPSYHKSEVKNASELDVIRTIQKLPSLTVGVLSLEAKLDRDPRYNQYVYDFVLDGPTPFSLHILAEALSGLPVTVTKMVCSMSPYFVDNCVITFSAVTPKSR